MSMSAKTMPWQPSRCGESGKRVTFPHHALKIQSQQRLGGSALESVAHPWRDSWSLKILIFLSRPYSINFPSSPFSHGRGRRCHDDQGSVNEMCVKATQQAVLPHTEGFFWSQWAGETFINWMLPSSAWIVLEKLVRLIIVAVFFFFSFSFFGWQCFLVFGSTRNV